MGHQVEWEGSRDGGGYRSSTFPTSLSPLSRLFLQVGGKKIDKDESKKAIVQPSILFKLEYLDI